MKTCGTCGAVEKTTGESRVYLRPYGPGGSLICFPCGSAPEREKATRAALAEHMDRVFALGRGVEVEAAHAPTLLDHNRPEIQELQQRKDKECTQ